MIQLTNLSYRYGNGRSDALSSITTTIHPGIHLLMGENGAGKTTLLQIIAGLLRPAPAGQCAIDGTPTYPRTPASLERCVFVSDDMTLPFATIRQMVKRHAVFYPNFSEKMLQANLQALGVSDTERIDTYSLGNRRKVQLAYVLALQPDVLLLDEPANGLDIVARQTLLTLMSRCISPTQTVIISTHSVWDFLPLIESVTVINHGRMLLNTPTSHITSRLAFVSSSTPPERALYVQPYTGHFQAIVPTGEHQGETAIDYALLYTGLLSQASRTIIKHLS